MGPRDLRCDTWYLNKEGLRGWATIQWWVRIEGIELKQVGNQTQRKKGIKLKTQVLCSEGPRS